MEALLKLLSGNKSLIGIVISLTIGYLFAKQYIDETTFYYLGALNAVLFKTASMATQKMYAKQITK